MKHALRADDCRGQLLHRRAHCSNPVQALKRSVVACDAFASK